ncbi:hypothetical protein SAMN05443663_101458 [Flavobacterium defluvii]|uniref:Uncharacterized protein n=1 Tax=Flavobacterium defluvii TaxID=370979 RepID=A0A1M5FEU4_9FLAO|nr:hypothetical protein SAMN05443663_101458 [Flavobacterium defluvii]
MNLKEPLITNTTKILKARKLKFPKTNLILRTYFALFKIVFPQEQHFKNYLLEQITTSAKKLSFD